MNGSSSLFISNFQKHQNILPLESNSLDLVSMDQRNETFAANWMEQLFQKGQLQLSTQSDHPTSEILQHFYFSTRNHERTKGIPTLGFGYPLLLWKLDDTTIAAPLFIWQLDLSLAPGAITTWVFSHGKDEQVFYNRELVDMLGNFVEYDIEAELSKAVRQGKITPKALVECCNEIAAHLGVENDSQSITITECPTAEALADLALQGAIQWSGVVGLFPPQIPVAAMAEDWSLTEDITYKGHDFGLLPLDPYQSTAFQSILKQKTTIVEGNAGTGKTHLLVHLLTNALSNGHRCLVVSENLGALHQVQNRLAQVGLTQFNFLFQDSMTDKPVLLDFLRNIANADLAPAIYDENNYRAWLDKSTRLKNKLDENYQAVRRNIFGPLHWTGTVGQFLRSNRIEGKELLSSQLNPQDFEFSYDEYLNLQQSIATSFPLYSKINTLKHPLSNLHPGVFTKQSKESSLDYITQQIKAFLDKAGSLHYRFITKINLYTDQLSEHYEGYYGELANRLTRLKDQMADYSSRYGTDFDQAGAGALKLRGVFSGKVKSVLEARDEVAEAYLDLVNTFERDRYFDFQFTPTSDGKNVQKVKQNLVAFEKGLHTWRDSLPSLVQEELARLSAQNNNEDLHFGDQISELEYALDLLAEELNEAKLYERPFENKMLTLPKRQKYLEEIIEQLENTRLYLRDYDHFYDWQRNWLSLPDRATKVIRALVKVKPHDWLQAFESWYLNNCLTNASQSPLPTEDKAIGDFVRSYNQLKQLLPMQISARWQSAREEAFKSLRRNNKDAFNQLFGKKNQEAAAGKNLQELLKKGLDAVTTVYPVMLATPFAAAHILPEQWSHFDYVLFDEAQYLTLKENLKPLQLGKKTVIFGDCSRLPTKDESVLLGWAKAQEIPAVKLKTYHRWNPGNLLQLLNGKDIDEAAIGQFNINFEQLDGRYDEAEGTNDEEAQRIIHLLNEVKPTEKRTFPTVGIACFTVAQRDLIASYLLKIKQKWSPGVEKIQQLERNGLGVFYIDELRGQHFDILIVSSTYGIMNARGELTAHADALNMPDFTCSIRLLMSRPLQQLFIINSIPEASWERWLDMPEQPGIFLLANYFAYNQALQAADAGRQQNIAQRLKDWAQPDENQLQERIFLEEIAITLQPYLGKDRLKIGAEEAELKLPLLIENVHHNQPGVVLQPDGFAAYTPFTDYIWEDQQRDLITKRGFVYQSIWSLNWWKNPRQESRKLASAMIKMDSEYVTDL